MIAEIIAAGSEMLTPYRQDTNSLFLTSELNDLGVTVAFKTIVGDNFEHLTSAISIALSRADIVITSGGLGPTEDDLTREAAAAALAIGLNRDAELLLQLQARFAKRNIPMPPNNSKQADILNGAEILPNANGSAVGQFLRTTISGADHSAHQKTLILLPGPPREIKPVFLEECVPRLAALVPPRVLAKRIIRMAVIPESTVDARTAPIYKQYSDVETTILAHNGEIQLHFLCAKPTLAEAQARVDEVAGRVVQEMDDAVFSTGGESLEEVVLLLLGAKNMTLATAESCTGGLLAQRLTSVPGSSRSVLGGAVVYSNALKTAFADVPAELIAREGAVSAPVAQALAEGIRKRAGASVGISITGIAGPGGGEAGPDEHKPVGLVFIGFADRAGTVVKEFNITGDRERIRWWAAQYALDFIRRAL